MTICIYVRFQWCNKVLVSSCVFHAMKRHASSAFGTEDDGDNADAFPDGPKVFSDLFSWPERFFHRLQSRFPDEWAECCRHLKNRSQIILGTSFSGMGTAEIGLKMISAFLQKQGVWSADRTLVYGSCDSCPKSRQILCHQSHCSSHHVFKDVCAAVTPTVVQKRHNFLKPLRDSFLNDPKGSDRAALERKFHTFASKLLSTTSFDRDVLCVKCNKLCKRFWSPPSSSSGLSRKDYLLVEVGGSPCIPFVKGGLFVFFYFGFDVAALQHFNVSLFKDITVVCRCDNVNCKLHILFVFVCGGNILDLYHKVIFGRGTSYIVCILPLFFVWNLFWTPLQLWWNATSRSLWYWIGLVAQCLCGLLLLDLQCKEEWRGHNYPWVRSKLWPQSFGAVFAARLHREEFCLECAWWRTSHPQRTPLHFLHEKFLAPASLNFQEHVWQQLVFCNRVASADIFSKLLELTLTFHFSYQHPYFVVTAFHMSWLACERGALA